MAHPGSVVPGQETLTGFAAVVLAGGRASGLDGFDKASVEIEGRTLLTHALDAVIDASEVVVVGNQVSTQRPVTFVLESPRYGGPVAALATGYDVLLGGFPTVAVLAVDMPGLAPDTFRRLHAATEAASDADGAVLVGPDGRRQLTLVLTTDAFDRERPGLEEQHGMALHALLDRLTLVDVPAVGEEHRDVDTWADLRDLSR